jgi:hypothetical protein
VRGSRVKTRIGPIAFAAAVLALASCTSLAQKPEGFAEVSPWQVAAAQYKAVSPEGMIYRVRTLKNYPVQTLEFWASALKNHLEKEGYRSVSDGQPFEAGESPGMLFEWAMPYGNQSYIYITAIVVAEKKIAVAEAAAEHTIYYKYREALLESLASITIR